MFVTNYWIPAYAGMTVAMESRYPAFAGTSFAGMTVAMDSRYPACAGTGSAGMTVA